jgi:two-component system, OmpR family, phosphate regulon response regulator PhoB
MKAKILLLEDDPGLSATLVERLQNEGYQTILAGTKAEALAEFEHANSGISFDLLILDIGLPDGSGLDFARDVRLHSAVPIVFLSAINSAGYRLEGYEIGAEDYIPKPFHIKELLLRINKVLSRSNLEGSVSFGNFSIDFESRSVAGVGIEPVFFSGKDSDVLKYLIESYPRVVSRQELLKNVWNEKDEGQSGRTVDNCIVRLRQQLKPFNEECIRSARGIGYQWLIERSVTGR